MSDVDAMTKREVVSYWINTSFSYLDRAFDDINKKLNMESFDESVFLAEKKAVHGVALQWENRNDAYEKVFDELYMTLFDSNHPLYYDCVGSLCDCSSISVDDCYKFYRKNYIGREKFLVIFGGIDLDKLQTLVESIDLIYGDKEYMPLPRYSHRKRKVASNTQTPENIIAWRVDSKEIRNSGILNFARFILGGSENSVFFKQLRDTHQVAYDTRTHLDNYTDMSVLQLYFGLSAGSSVEYVIELVIDTIRNIKHHLFSLMYLRKRIKSDYISGLRFQVKALTISQSS